MGQTNQKNSRTPSRVSNVPSSARPYKGYTSVPNLPLEGGAEPDSRQALLLHALMSQLDTLQKDILDKKIMTPAQLDMAKEMMSKQIDKVVKEKGLEMALQTFISQEPLKQIYEQITAKANHQVDQVIEEQQAGSTNLPVAAGKKNRTGKPIRENSEVGSDTESENEADSESESENEADRESES